MFFLKKNIANSLFCRLWFMVIWIHLQYFINCWKFSKLIHCFLGVSHFSYGAVEYSCFASFGLRFTKARLGHLCQTFRRCNYLWAMKLRFVVNQSSASSVFRLKIIHWLRSAVLLIVKLFCTFCSKITNEFILHLYYLSVVWFWTLKREMVASLI